MASIRKGKQRPYTVEELDGITTRSRLDEAAMSKGHEAGRGRASGGVPAECPPLLTGGVHPEIPARGVQPDFEQGGYLVHSDDGPKVVPLQRATKEEPCVIDYATFTFAEKAIHRLNPKLKPFTDVEIVESVADYMLDAILGKTADLLPGGGMNGYRASVKAGQYMMIAGGANNDTIMVTIYGFAFASCDPGMPKRLAQLIDAIPSAHLTRIDIAYDDFAREIFNPWKIEQQWNAGQFSATNSPKKSKLKFDGDYLRGDPDGMGITAYIGSKGSGKYIRIYEKGRQLGDPKSQWVRAEVELSNSVYQLVPEMLIRPTSYFVMLCPAFSQISYQQGASKIERQGREALTTVEKVVETIRTQYGTYLSTLRQEFYGSDRELLDAVCRTGKTPKVLERAIQLSDAALNVGPDHFLQQSQISQEKQS